MSKRTGTQTVVPFYFETERRVFAQSCEVTYHAMSPCNCHVGNFAFKHTGSRIQDIEAEWRLGVVTDLISW